MVNNELEQTDSRGPEWRREGPWSQTNIMHSSLSDPADRPQRQLLSSLMDGDLAPGELSGAIARWREDDDARASWHAYHLIGDVLRSDDLATAPARDERFLRALRARLADEPATPAAAPQLAAVPPGPETSAPMLPPLVQADAVPARRRANGWLMAPAAVAAGFVVVAGVLVVNRMTASTQAAAPQMALNQPAPGALVRDARLDRYLAAHRNLGNGLAGAGGAERSVQIVFEPK
jgi:sigma-E factor negative regulatory protein RseA